MSSTPYRFGISRLPPSVSELRRHVRGLEAAGFDFVAQGDHVAGGVSPFAMLAAAAAVTDGLRLRTYVINTGLWNDAFLAREADTLDRLSDGRFELGLGAGNAKSEFDAIGAPWQPPDARFEQMKDTLLSVRRRVSDAQAGRGTPTRPVPVLVGAMSRAGLQVAGDHADVIAFSGLRHKPGHPPGTPTAVTAQRTDELVTLARRHAGQRRVQSDILLQSVSLGKDSLAAAKAWVEQDDPTEDPMELAQSPCVLFARTAADAAAELEARRQRWGFTSITTFAESSNALAAVMRELR